MRKILIVFVLLVLCMPIFTSRANSILDDPEIKKSIANDMKNAYSQHNIIFKTPGMEKALKECRKKNKKPDSIFYCRELQDVFMSDWSPPTIQINKQDVHYKQVNNFNWEIVLLWIGGIFTFILGIYLKLLKKLAKFVTKMVIITIKKIKEMVERVKKNQVNLTISPHFYYSVAMILSCFIIAFAFIFNEHQKIQFEKEKFDFRNQRQADLESNKEILNSSNEMSRNNCFDEAEDLHVKLWDKACKTNGLKKDCALPLALANSINKDLKTNKNNCFREFPVIK